MKMLRLRQVLETTGLSRMTIYRLELQGKFPQRRRLGLNSVAWLDDEIDAWLKSRPAISGGKAGGSSRRPTLCDR